MQYVLAVDQGTSGTKAVIFDAAGAVCAKGFEPVPCAHPRPGWCEQDAEALYRSVVAAARQCLQRFDGSASRIAGVAISNQRETVVLWDREGKPIAPAVSWQCQRSLGICERMREQGMAQRIEERTGLSLDPYFSASKLIWLHENDANVRTAIDEGRAYFGTVDSWLLFRMTGGRAHLTNYTNASRTMLFNLDALQWDRELIAEFELEALHLPALRASASAFGATDLEGLLGKAVPVVSMIGDSHAATVGEGCLEPGLAKATMGTGSSLMMNVGRSRRVSSGGLVSTLCFGTESRVDYGMEGIIISAGSTPSWLKDKLGLFDDFATAEQAFAEVDNGGVYLIPAFSGIGCPHWKHPGGAQIVGLTFSTSWQHVVRAAYESIVYQIKDVITVMERAAQVPLVQLFVDGGLVQRPFLLQYLADTLDRPVSTLETTEVSALGAATLGLLQLGVIGDLDANRHARTVQRRVEPGRGRERAAGNHAQWLKWIERL